jgi:hypothetical protein
VDVVRGDGPGAVGGVYSQRTFASKPRKVHRLASSVL